MSIKSKACTYLTFLLMASLFADIYWLNYVNKRFYQVVYARICGDVMVIVWNICSQLNLYQNYKIG